MTAGELIKVLQEVPADTPVGRSGHYGELVELYGARPSKNVTEAWGPKNGWGRAELKTFPVAVILEVSDLGEGPD